MQPTILMICHDCGLVQKIPNTVLTGTIRCVRCDAVLEKRQPDTTDISLALSVTGLILFILVNIFPFLTFHMGGQTQETTMITGIRMFFHQGWWPLGCLVFFVAIVAPAVFVTVLLYILIPIRMGRTAPGLPQALRLLSIMQPWCMIEIFMLGILVTVVKLTGDGEVILGVSLYAFMAFTFVQAAMFHNYNPQPYWKIWNSRCNTPQSIGQAEGNFLVCRNCRFLCEATSQLEIKRCPRCDCRFHHRKKNSISRTWALVLTAAIFYIPANLLPMTDIVSFGEHTTDTIFSGVVYFVKTGMWPLALIIFTASIFIPLLKLLVMVFLLLSVQLRVNWRPKDRTYIYRITEAVGRWSMVDIFAITVLIALVNMGNLATVQVKPAALFFAAVVIFTMLAAMTFDPKLIWDEEHIAYAHDKP